MSELVKALIAARKQMTAAKKGKDNPFFKSKYADLSSVIEAIKEPLELHGLTFVQDIENGSVVTVVLHESGETMRLAPFPILSSKQDAQGVGSGTTYARRYSLQTALGVPAEDDDGNAASQPVQKFPSPVKSALPSDISPELIAKAKAVAQSFIDLHADSADGSTDYGCFELAESLDTELKLAVWSELAQHSKVRAWIKKVQAEHRKVAA